MKYDLVIIERDRGIFTALQLIKGAQEKFL